MSLHLLNVTLLKITCRSSYRISTSISWAGQFYIWVTLLNSIIHFLFLFIIYADRYRKYLIVKEMKLSIWPLQLV